MDTRYVYFVRARKPAATLFFSNNGTIFGAAEMEIYLITDTRALHGCGGSDMRFVLSDVDYALMEYYRYAGKRFRTVVYTVKFCASNIMRRWIFNLTFHESKIFILVKKIFIDFIKSINSLL